MEITAKVISRLQKREGTSASGKAWVSQQYIVQYDYDKEHPHNVVMSFFGENRVAEAANVLRKDYIAKFAFDINAHEADTKNGKQWFGSNDCFSVVLVDNTQAAPVQQTPVQPQAAPVNNNPAPQQTGENVDDLPF